MDATQATGKIGLSAIGRFPLDREVALPWGYDGLAPPPAVRHPARDDVAPHPVADPLRDRDRRPAAIRPLQHPDEFLGLFPDERSGGPPPGLGGGFAEEEEAVRDPPVTPGAVEPRRPSVECEPGRAVRKRHHRVVLGAPIASRRRRSGPGRGMRPASASAALRAPGPPRTGGPCPGYRRRRPAACPDRRTGPSPRGASRPVRGRDLRQGGICRLTGRRLAGKTRQQHQCGDQPVFRGFEAMPVRSDHHARLLGLCGACLDRAIVSWQPGAGRGRLTRRMSATADSSWRMRPSCALDPLEASLVDIPPGCHRRSHRSGSCG